MRRRWCAAAVMLIACGACTGDPAPAGQDQPLRTNAAGSSTTSCIPAQADGRMTWGFESTRNVTDEVLTVDSIELGESQGVRIFERKVMAIPPDASTTLMGVVGWPPDLSIYPSDIRRQYALADDAHGAKIPARDGTTISWVVGLEIEPGASMNSLVVTYRDEDGQEYTWTSGNRLVVGDPDCF